jgi:hypothetical protein
MFSGLPGQCYPCRYQLCLWFSLIARRPADQNNATDGSEGPHPGLYRSIREDRLVDGQRSSGGTARHYAFHPGAVSHVFFQPQAETAPNPSSFRPQRSGCSCSSSSERWNHRRPGNNRRPSAALVHRPGTRANRGHLLAGKASESCNVMGR